MQLVSYVVIRKYDVICAIIHPCKRAIVLFDPNASGLAQVVVML